MTYLPYSGTEGWSGSDSSSNRDGINGKYQKEVINCLLTSAEQGLTWVELQKMLQKHHGTLTGALSALHKGGFICRLSETRGKSKVYVLPEFVQGRETEPQGRNKSCPNCGEKL